MAFFSFGMNDPMEAMQNCFRQAAPHMNNMGFPMFIPTMREAHAEASAGSYRPWRTGPGQRNGNDDVSTIHNDGDTFRIDVNVKNFSAQDISVKVVDNSIIVEGKHEERQENEKEYVSRHIVRRYEVPEGVRTEAISSSLSSDGFLIITAPKIRSTQEESGRSIPIVVTGLPAKNSTSSDPSTSKKDEKTAE